jgi:hypothetical protein
MDLETLMHTEPWDWPEDAGESLLGILKDEQTGEEDLCVAALLAGEYTVVDDDITLVLLEMVGRSGAPEAVRAAAATGLGPALEDADSVGPDMEEAVISGEVFHRIQETLREVYEATDGPKEVRRRVLESSVRAPQEWHEAAVREAYASGDRDWRVTAVYSMSYLSGFDAEILECLGDKDPEIHYEAVSAAGAWELDDAWDHVKGLVTDEKTEMDLRMAAMDSAACIRPEEAVEILEELSRSVDEELAEAALEAMSLAQGASGYWGEEEEG